MAPCMQNKKMLKKQGGKVCIKGKAGKKRMGGFFGVASQQDCVFDLFFGIDYHSHLGTRRGGMAVYGKDGFNRAIHNIENAPFRTKFDKDVNEMHGNYGIGCISDYEPQPLIIRSHHGTYALTTVGKINNTDELIQRLFDVGHAHFQEMSGGEVNATELVAALINRRENLIEGINFALHVIDGSLSILLMNKAGIYAARDKYGRTPVVVGRKEDGFCASFENFAYKNLGYANYKELGPGEVVVMTEKNCVTLVNPQSDMKICTFLWVYYGYRQVRMRESVLSRCGTAAARRWHSATMHGRTLSRGFRIPASRMRWGMRMSQGFRFPDRLSSTRRHGRALLCRRYRASAISSPR